MLSDHLHASAPGLPRLESGAPPPNPTRRVVIVVRADPVICGHSGEARNPAETALTRGFDDVRIVTWPITALQDAGLPLKPLETVLPYSSDFCHFQASGFWIFPFSTPSSTPRGLTI